LCAQEPRLRETERGRQAANEIPPAHDLPEIRGERQPRLPEKADIATMPSSRRFARRVKPVDGIDRSRPESDIDPQMPLHRTFQEVLSK
jgi:hypothetical protein